MHKIVYPECDCCGSARPEYESTQWSLRICYTCLRMVADWLDAHDLLTPNVLVQDLFDGVFSGGTVPQSHQYTVVVKSKLGASAFAYKLIGRIQTDAKESS